MSSGVIFNVVLKYAVYRHRCAVSCRKNQLLDFHLEHKKSVHDVDKKCKRCVSSEYVMRTLLYVCFD